MKSAWGARGREGVGDSWCSRSGITASRFPVLGAPSGTGCLHWKQSFGDLESWG
jgi:hypothetical protein